MHHRTITSPVLEKPCNRSVRKKCPPQNIRDYGLEVIMDEIVLFKILLATILQYFEVVLYTLQKYFTTIKLCK